MKINYNGIELDVLPPVKRYMNGIERRLNADRATKVRIMTELAGDFAARREAGQSDADIMADMGTPEAVAAEFNASLGTRPASRWRWAFVAIAAAGVISLLYAYQHHSGNWFYVGRIASAYLTRRIYTLFTGQPTEIYDSHGVLSFSAIPAQVENLVGHLCYLLPLLLACLAGFLLLGWCRRGKAQRYALSIALSAVGSALMLLIWLCAVLLIYPGRAIMIPETPPFIVYYLQGLPSLFFSSGLWLCLIVLVWGVVEVVRTRSRQKNHEE